MNKQFWPEFNKAIAANVKAATGCTEPISLAFASAVAAKTLGAKVEKIEGKCSPNLLKNGMGVTVPGTGMTGMLIAAALGAVAGDPDADLNVLGNCTPEQVAEAKKMLEENRVTVGIADRNDNLYSESKVINGNDWARVCIADHHTHIILIEKNGETLFTGDSRVDSGESFDLTGVKFRDIYDYATNAPFDMIKHILQSQVINDALSVEGLSGNYGMHIARSLQNQLDKGLIAKDLLSDIIIRTGAASDARMGGATLPAMSNSGSGNQGIAATMPVVVVGQKYGIDEEKMARALIMSHMTAIYVHQQFDPLSALCAAITASMGSAAGMAWIMDGKYDTCAKAISNMVGDVTGMICDGASNSCAIKVTTAISCAYKAVLLAMDNSFVDENDGIVTDDVDTTINSLSALAKGSMKHTDKQIIEIMVKK